MDIRKRSISGTDYLHLIGVTALPLSRGYGARSISLFGRARTPGGVWVVQNVGVHDPNHFETHRVPLLSFQPDEKITPVLNEHLDRVRREHARVSPRHDLTWWRRMMLRSGGH